MATRQIGIAVAAAIYGTVHYVVVAGELAKGAGWTDLPGPILKVFDLGFLCLAVIVACFLIPKLLRLNIAVSRALLAGLSWCGELANRSLNAVRHVLIIAVERLASWLRGQEGGNGTLQRLDGER